jgi:multidrug efflux pump subunit AcrB
MTRLVGWFASNPVAANLLMACVVAAGLLGMSTLRQETFPNVAFDTIGVSVAYPDAAPDEVEEALCIPIEEAIDGVRGVQRVTARAIEGHAAVWAELAVGADAQRVLGDIQTRIDALDLPDEAERPVVRELLDDSVLLGIAIHGDVDERTLRLVGERVRDEVGDLAAVERSRPTAARS